MNKMQFVYELTLNPKNGVCKRDHLTCNVCGYLIHSGKMQQGR